jgi:hypothetical protein
MPYIGYDPGGAGAFGWCVVHGASLPLQVLARGLADNAQEAVTQSLAAIKGGEVLAAGIDAPLFWRPDGDRVVDRVVRENLKGLGGQVGTVNHVNSLRGACLVQGMVAAILLRGHRPNLPVSESHPKAMLWLLKIAQARDSVDVISFANLQAFFAGSTNGASNHERDAALGALCAWAMLNQPQGWQNLHLQELNPVSPLTAPLGYWMPI